MVKILIIEDDDLWIDLLKDELPEKIENCKVYGILFNSSNNEKIINDFNKLGLDKKYYLHKSDYERTLKGESLKWKILKLLKNIQKILNT